MSTLKLQRAFSLLALIVMVLAAVAPMGVDARPSNASTAAPRSLTGEAKYPVSRGISPEMRNVPVLNATETKPDRVPMTFDTNRKVVDTDTSKVDGALQTNAGNKKYYEDPMPSLDTGLNGANQGSNRTVQGYGVLPPDTDGDVSDTHYIQVVNNVVTIWDITQANPNTGLPLNVFGPAAMSRTIFGGLVDNNGDPSACAIWDDGDPIVLYDHLADRWMISQFALPNYPNAPFSECIAISATSDPLGAWYRYEYQFPVMNDYPHFGVWSDGYYMSINQFTPWVSPSWAGQGVVVFERDVMLTGGNARMIYIDTNASCVGGTEPECVLGGMLPSELDGPIPPAGEPNHFMQFDDDAWGYSPDQVQIWDFDTDWTAGTATFTHVASLPVAAFDSEVCTGYARNCIPQPGTAQGVDAIADRLMYRLQYRNFGTYQTLVTNHTVDVNDVAGHAGIRWYELRKVNGIWGVYQQGTYSPDAAHRWMGSAALDGNGNLAIGYSVSDGTSIYPGIRYAGRLSTDPLNTLPQGETVMLNGTGSQTNAAARWGDYSSLAVSPSDDCQFWYTQEWNRVTSSAEWYTYIGAFTYPTCEPHTPFSDVNDLNWYAPFVYRLSDMGITTGCGGGAYCPSGNLTRASMAVFLLRTIYGGTYTPPVATGTMFADVPSSHWAAAWIEKLAVDGISTGCNGGNFCPNSNVTRAEMAIFLLRAEHGPAYTPPAATGTMFGDVPGTHWAAAWIEQLATEVISSGCGGGNFCPSSNLTRAEMAVFLIRLYELLP